MIRLLFLLAACSVAILTPQACRAQILEVPKCQVGVGVPTLPRIQGFVQDASQNGIAGARLELMKLHPDGKVDRILETQSTDPKGRFRFKRHKDEIYAIRVTTGDRKFEELKLRQGSSAMFPGGGLMNFVLLVEGTPCISISLTR